MRKARQQLSRVLGQVVARGFGLENQGGGNRPLTWPYSRAALRLHPQSGEESLITELARELGDDRHRVRAVLDFDLPFFHFFNLQGEQQCVRHYES